MLPIVAALFMSSTLSDLIIGKDKSLTCAMSLKSITVKLKLGWLILFVREYPKTR